MQFSIENKPVFSTLVVSLTAGETARAEAGAMVSMSANIDLKSKTTGKGLFGAVKAAVGGESFFASEFTAEGGPGELVLAPATPGDILHLSLQGQTVFAQSGAYLAGSPDLELSTKGSLRAMVSGEGLFLQQISGSGDLFLSAYGAIMEKTLQADEEYVVDTGHMVAFEESVTYTIRKASKGLFSTLASGEGLVCRFKGPGKLWIQNRNLSGFAAMLARLTNSKK